MKYEIYGGSFPAVEVTLDAGQSVVSQAGTFGWSDTSIEMETNARGGFLKSLGRAFSGTSLMFSNYRATQDNSKISFTSVFPGTILPFEVDENHSYYAQKSAFLVGDPSVEVDATVNKKFFAGLLGGEGFIIQKFTGNGTVLAEIDGSVKEIELAAGQQIKVSTSNVAVFESTVTYDIQSIKGVKNVIFGGEGFFTTTLTGPGKVWVQTLTAADMAQKLIPYLPSSSTTVHTSND